jgi:competence ComEA-like helix-hairpin-helix protein
MKKALLGLSLLAIAQLANALDLNTATVDELKTNGIAKNVAQNIVDYRNGLPNKQFISVDQLTKVKGIGEKTFNAIRGKFDPIGGAKPQNMGAK